MPFDSKEWYRRNRDRVLVNRRLRDKANAEKIREQTKKWRQENPERQKEARRRFYLKHRERVLAQSNERYALVADKVRQYRADNLDLMRERDRRWRAANLDKARAMGRKSFHKKMKTLAETDPVKLEEYRKRASAGCKKFKLKRYGLTPQAFSDLFLSQNGACKICGLALDFSSTVAVPAIDHHHESGKVRGILCLRCNSGLGMFSDNQDTLAKAIAYLQESEACRLKA